MYKKSIFIFFSFRVINHDLSYTVMLNEDKFSRPRPRTSLRGWGRGGGQKFGLEASLSSRTYM